MHKTAIHYDCDPGQDDAVALLYALGSDKIDVQSISVVGGNVDVMQCARNALQILELADRTDIPVYIGARKPLDRVLHSLPEVFGITGMAGAETWPSPKQYAIEMRDLSSVVKTSVIAATAPLTNLALQLQKNPAFAASIDHLYIMGGCPYPEPLRQRMGNYIPPGAFDYAEYNFAVDPEAAKIVFQNGFKAITLIGLNVTRMVLYNADVDAALRSIRTPVSLGIADILSSVGEDDLQDYGHLRKTSFDPVRAMHDVVAMAAIDAPELFTFETVPLRIRTDAQAPGQSPIDADDYDHPGVRVAISLNIHGFLNRMIKNISAL
ncbi:MAG TPA: nucleoside hydrolase [Alphaproteobacteria bacterium]